MALLASNVDIDLSQLNDEERHVILEVVRRDRELRQNELDYIEKLQSDVERLRDFTVKADEDKCARCGAEFWWLFKRGEFCEECRRKVCVDCRRPVKAKDSNNIGHSWLCILCSKERELRAMTGAWFYQSLKFRRSKRLRKSNRSKPPSLAEPVVRTPPPVEYFFYYSLSEPISAKHEIGPDEVDSMLRSSRQYIRSARAKVLPTYQKRSNDSTSDSLSDISEGSEVDSDDSDDSSLSSLVDVNGNEKTEEVAVVPQRVTKVRFEDDAVDQNFGAVAEHNRRLLLKDGVISDNSQTIAKVLAESIVGEVVQMKKDYVEIQLAAASAVATQNNADVDCEDSDYDEAMALLSEFGATGFMNQTDSTQSAAPVAETAVSVLTVAAAVEQKTPDVQPLVTIVKKNPDMSRRNSAPATASVVAGSSASVNYRQPAVNTQSLVINENVSVKTKKDSVPSVDVTSFQQPANHSSYTASATQSNGSEIKLENFNLSTMPEGQEFLQGERSQIISSYESIYNQTPVSQSHRQQNAFDVAGIAPDYHADISSVDSDSVDNTSVNSSSRGNRLTVLQEEDGRFSNGVSIEPISAALPAARLQDNVIDQRPNSETVEMLKTDPSDSQRMLALEINSQRFLPQQDSIDSSASENNDLSDVVDSGNSAEAQLSVQPVSMVMESRGISVDSDVASAQNDVERSHTSSPSDNGEAVRFSEGSPTDQQSTSNTINSYTDSSSDATKRHHIPPQSSLEISTDEQGEDADEAFYSQSSQTTPRSAEGNALRMRSMSGLSSVTSGSRDSLASDFSVLTHVKVSGEICIVITYNVRYTMLELVIKECRDLAAVSGKTSNPYVKVYIMPDKKKTGKKKTKIIKKTLNPKFEETIRYDLTRAELVDCTLWISVWHSGRLGRSVFLGDILIPLESYNVDSNKPEWLQLLQQGREKWKSLSNLSTKSAIDVALKYITPDALKSRKTKPVKGELHVKIVQASGLISAKSSGSNAFCRLCLQPEKLSKHSRLKTHIIKHDCNPVWNQEFIFPDITLSDVTSSRTLELTVWDQERLTSKSLLGKVVLGPAIPSDSARESTSNFGKETSLWQEMLNNANEWVNGSLLLQQSTDSA